MKENSSLLKGLGQEEQHFPPHLSVLVEWKSLLTLSTNLFSQVQLIESTKPEKTEPRATISTRAYELIKDTGIDAIKSILLSVKSDVT